MIGKRFLLVALLAVPSGCQTVDGQMHATTPALATPLQDQSHDTYERLMALSESYYSLPDSEPVSAFGFQTAHSRASVMQIWQRPDQPIHSSTVFFLDEGVLYARHYCPHANQPLLRLVSFDGTTASFEFVSMTGVRDAPHLYSLQLTLDGDDTLGYRSIYRTGERAHDPWDVRFVRNDRSLFDSPLD